jgi:hypothetical protein
MISYLRANGTSLLYQQPYFQIGKVLVCTAVKTGIVTSQSHRQYSSQQSGEYNNKSCGSTIFWTYIAFMDFACVDMYAETVLASAISLFQVQMTLQLLWLSSFEKWRSAKNDQFVFHLKTAFQSKRLILIFYLEISEVKVEV